MPKSVIEAQFVKATKIKPDDYTDRKKFMAAVVDKMNSLPDKHWNSLTEPAQLWFNEAITARRSKKNIKEFPDVGAVDPDADEAEDEAEDDAEDKKSVKKTKVKAKAEPEEDEAEDDEDEAEDDAEDEAEDDAEDDAEDEDEAEEEEEKPKAKTKTKTKTKPAEEEEDEEETKPKKKTKAKVEEEDEAEEETKPKKKTKAKPADDEEEDKPKAKKKVDKAVATKPTGVKVAIKEAILENPEISVDDLVKKLGKGGADVSKVTVGNVRADFRHSLKVLKENGKLKGIDI